ncbi:hypothetical protein DDZ18_05620 [Marinicauda salina]|jgi:plastocyanin|uniref:Blue (type 1) copper domain-containing protein n=1 Tax=Marinicauda salina TaxID=2135793 RepID=A0A2U2BT75_9PROT|nr:plastocyanin/azurin family copper-binding protein [Marinicauda salina]PWE17176.1 hypothetical protein DDZ18_05620 [Marinicauda salina]
MTPTRRLLLQAGGTAIAVPLLPLGRARGQEAVFDIVMGGRGGGAQVWFDPVGVLIAPGTRVRWTNLDRANVHTATAYHPDNFGKPARIPVDAAPFDSGYLAPGETFETILTAEGVYDYYCIPHEAAGMAGRILVGTCDDAGFDAPADGRIPRAVADALPAIDAIRASGVVRPAG